MVILSIGNFSFSRVSLSSGLLKCSLLRPICFSIYILPVQQNIRSPGTSCHRHANGTRLFLLVEINDRKLIDSLLKTLYKCKNCVKCNLQWNADKPEVMILGPDTAGKQHFWAHYVLISPLITSDRVTRCVQVHDRLWDWESAMIEGEWAFSVENLSGWFSSESHSFPLLC